MRGLDPEGAKPWKPTSVRIFNRINALYGLSGCHGTSNPQNARVLDEDYGIHMRVRFNVPWDDYIALISSGRGGEVTIRSYGTLRGTRYDSCPSFSGRHAVYVNERKHLEAGVAFPAAGEGWYWRVADPLADGRWLSSIGRRAVSGYQWWPTGLFRRCVTYSLNGEVVVDACDFTIDTEQSSLVRLKVPSPIPSGWKVNIREDPDTSSDVYAVAKSDGIYRGDQKLTGLALAMPLRKWVEGGQYTVKGVTGTTWADVLIAGGYRSIAKPLVRVV